MKFPDSIRVLQDTSEKKPLRFPRNVVLTNGFSEQLVGVEVIKKSLETGDYAIAGFEHLAVVERKGSVEELWQNFFDPKDRVRWQKCVVRLRRLKFATIFLDFPQSDWYRPHPHVKLVSTAKVRDHLYRMCALNRLNLIQWTPASKPNAAVRSGEEVIRILAGQLTAAGISLETKRGS